MLVKVNENNVVEQFPYDIYMLKQDNPTKTFPSRITPEILKEFGVFEVTAKRKPVYDITTHRINRNNIPELVSGNWVLGWTISPINSDETLNVRNLYKANTTKEADRRVSLISGDSTSKLMSLMVAVDLLDKRGQRPLNNEENGVLSRLRDVKEAVVAIRSAETIIKNQIDLSTGSELETLDIQNHPSWP